jgi:predicted nucleic acid-binding protein
VLYLDSSALIKHYIQEAGTDALNLKLQLEAQGPQDNFVSMVGYAEIFAMLARRSRENLLQQKEFELIQETFNEDWLFNLGHVELTVGVLAFIPGLVKKHPLKSSDAIHLASILWLRDTWRHGKSFAAKSRTVEFVTSDKQLKNAASLEGLKVFDPENPQ